MQTIPELQNLLADAKAERSEHLRAAALNRSLAERAVDWDDRFPHLEESTFHGQAAAALLAMADQWAATLRDYTFDADPPDNGRSDPFVFAELEAEIAFVQGCIADAVRLADVLKQTAKLVPSNPAWCEKYQQHAQRCHLEAVVLLAELDRLEAERRDWADA